MDSKNKTATKVKSTDTHNVWEVMGTTFTVEKHFKVIEPGKFRGNCVVGSGAYGTVASAEDLESNDEESKMVAIKKIERAFEHPLFAKRTLRELKILRLLSHENVSLS